MPQFNMRERQITFGNYGHTLNHRQVISPDGQWAAYDTRNEDSHIARTNAIELVRIDSGETVRLYQTRTQSHFGPGVGAVSFHPHEPRVVFIHGLESNSIENPYSAARRFGALIDVQNTNACVHAEARTLHDSQGHRLAETANRLKGALSGGTHAHSWNHDGWLSFTYNDAWLERQSQIDKSVRDIRTVGFMVPDMPIAIESQPGIQAGEEFGGIYAAFLAAAVTPAAVRDSDEIEYAVEECWIGTDAAIAFLGGVRDLRGMLFSEIYFCKLPSSSELRSSLLQCVIGQFDGSGSNASGLFKPIDNCEQRRLTHTSERKFPGVQGPRNWLVSSPSGKTLYAPMKDDRGVVQLFGVDVTTGSIEQITDLEFSIEGQITLNAAGTICGFVCQQRIVLVIISTGETRWLSHASEHRIVGAIHFADPGRLLFNRRVGIGADGWVQIFIGETV